MSDRKNLKIRPETYEQLREEKHEMETWDSMLSRLLRSSEGDA